MLASIILGDRKMRIYSKDIKQRARRLRSKGWSFGEISQKMKIPKNTISGWLKDILLTEKQKERIRQKIIDSGVIGRPLAIEANRKKVEKWKREVRQRVKHYGQLAHKNPEIEKLICGILYLCEGAKYPSTRCLIFGNTDPIMIRYFLNLLRKSFSINTERLRCRVMYRWDQDIDELNKYWSGITGIPLHHFFKTSPDKRTKGKPTLKNNYKGVCSIQYPNTSLQFELQSIGEAIIKGRL